MKLIKIEGDTKQVRAKKSSEDWSQRFGKVSAYAIIEFESSGLPRQERYVIYRHEKTDRLYCKVQRQRVYLDDIGYNENTACWRPEITPIEKDRQYPMPGRCPFCNSQLYCAGNELAKCGNYTCEFANLPMTTRHWGILAECVRGLATVRAASKYIREKVGTEPLDEKAIGLWSLGQLINETMKW